MSGTSTITRCGSTTVDSLRELLTSALEANLSLIAVAQNDSMKQLAAWAAIAVLPGDRGGVRDELPAHARARVVVARLPLRARPDGGGLRGALLAIQARGVALMRIVIMGSGGMWGFFGAKLARAGRTLLRGAGRATSAPSRRADFA